MDAIRCIVSYRLNLPLDQLEVKVLLTERVLRRLGRHHQIFLCWQGCLFELNYNWQIYICIEMLLTKRVCHRWLSLSIDLSVNGTMDIQISGDNCLAFLKTRNMVTFKLDILLGIVSHKLGIRFCMVQSTLGINFYITSMEMSYLVGFSNIALLFWMKSFTNIFKQVL